MCGPEGEESNVSTESSADIAEANPAVNLTQWSLKNWIQWCHGEKVSICNVEKAW